MNSIDLLPVLYLRLQWTNLQDQTAISLPVFDINPPISTPCPLRNECGIFQAQSRVLDSLIEEKSCSIHGTVLPLFGMLLDRVSILLQPPQGYRGQFLLQEDTLKNTLASKPPLSSRDARSSASNSLSFLKTEDSADELCWRQRELRPSALLFSAACLWYSIIFSKSRSSVLRSSSRSNWLHPWLPSLAAPSPRHRRSTKLQIRSLSLAWPARIRSPVLYMPVAKQIS